MTSGPGGPGHRYGGPSRPRIPPNRFSIPLGLAGLATAWHAAGAKLGTPAAVPGAIDILAAVVLLILGWQYAAKGLRQVLADLRDPVQAPFVAVPAITAMMLGAALASVFFAAGRILVVIFLAVTVIIGGGLAGQWIAAESDQAPVHPGYYLPTVAGGLVGAITLVQVHLHALAEASFGVGVVSWMLLGSVVLNRLITAKRLPAALQPVTAIELAPPALAGVAWFALAGRGITVIAYAFGGYLVLMATVQIRLIPVYRKLRFSPGFWSFTFSYAIAVTCALEWIIRTNPPGATGYAIAAIIAITVFIAAIAARTVVAVARSQFLAPPAATLPGPRIPTPGSASSAAESQPRRQLRPAPGRSRCGSPAACRGGSQTATMTNVLPSGSAMMACVPHAVVSGSCSKRTPAWRRRAYVSAASSAAKVMPVKPPTLSGDQIG